MNHITEIVVWYSEADRQACLVIERERGWSKGQVITTRMASRLAEAMYRLVLKRQVQLSPFVTEGCYGWHAHRI